MATQTTLVLLKPDCVSKNLVGETIKRFEGAELQIIGCKMQHLHAAAPVAVKQRVLEDNLRKDREIAEIQRQNFGKALKAGVKMVYGTDAGVYPHGQNARQFAVMVRYGATPLQAIQTATINSAEALGWKDKVGVIKPGAWGDLVGVTGDPTRDVTLLEHPASLVTSRTTENSLAVLLGMEKPGFCWVLVSILLAKFTVQNQLLICPIEASVN